MQLDIIVISNALKFGEGHANLEFRTSAHWGSQATSTTLQSRSSAAHSYNIKLTFIRR